MGGLEEGKDQLERTYCLFAAAERLLGYLSRLWEYRDEGGRARRLTFFTTK